MGMSFMLSPGITVREWDITQIIPQVATSGAALVGSFEWGPLEKISLVTDEESLVRRFGRPNSENFGYWFAAKNFLDYSRNLKIVRVVGEGSNNSYDNTATPVEKPMIKNINDWQDNHSIPSGNDWGQFAGRYPSAIANGIEIHMVDEDTFSAVQNVVVVNGGSGYDASDVGQPVTFSDPFDGGETATGEIGAVDGDGKVTSVTLTTGGKGYRNPPAVTIPAPLNSIGIKAELELVFGNNSDVTGVTITNAGAGYDGTESITIDAPNLSNSDALFDITDDGSGVVTGVTIANGGEGYGFTDGETIVLPGGNGDATVTVAVTNYSITGVTLVTGGTGYTTTANVVIPYTVSVANATITYTIDSAGAIATITITNNGIGYDGNEGINIPDPIVVAGQTATAEAELWEYYDQFLTIPETTTYTAGKNGSNDGLHIVVIDGAGSVTGEKGRVLERYAFCSKAVDATYDDGTSSYYPYVLRDRSAYIWFGDFPLTMDTGPGAWGNKAQDRSFNSLDKPVAVTLGDGNNGQAPSNNELIPGWELFNNTEEVDFGLAITGPADRILQNYVIQNVAEFRKDCIAFISPEASNSGGIGEGVINQKDREIDNLMKQNNVLPSTSYGVFDCNWKYQFDTYNDTFRWVPLNGDIAGLCARTDETRDPWWSPAGYNRGIIKNCVKLAWNPNRTQRDDIYVNNINPVVSMIGEGTLLYGDKTMLKQPSAFDRINVRRLFIVLEKAIAKAAKYMLFEFNDTFTRLRFVQMVEPYLRDVQGRRGIYDFKVVCDDTNNTPFVIDNNAFVGDIYIKPAKSINFITLNFVATGSGVVFEEIIGQFG
jgi:hypothetical protein